MVNFLLDNSLGAWWTARRLTESDLHNANSEEELRKKVVYSWCSFEVSPICASGGWYLWTPAAGTFDGWPEQLSRNEDTRPLLRLGPLSRGGFPDASAHAHGTRRPFGKGGGRCSIAGKHPWLGIGSTVRGTSRLPLLALTAWKYPDAGGYRVLPELNVACSGLSINVVQGGVEAVGNGQAHSLRIAMDWLYDDAFKDAPMLGSLLNPGKTDAAKLAQWDKLSSALEQALKSGAKSKISRRLQWLLRG